MTRGDLLGILANVGISAGILSVISVLIRDTIAGWLTSRVDHGYNVKLEHLRAELERTNSAALEALRRDNEQQLRFGATVTAAAAAGQAAAFTHRVDCIQRLWKALIDVRSNAPAVAGMTEWLTNDELIDQLRKAPSLLAQLQLDSERMLAGHGPEIEALRLMAGEYLWSLFFAHRQLTLRVCAYFELRLGGKVRSLKPTWKDDDVVQSILRATLSDAQREAFQSSIVGGLNYARGIIEAQFIKEASRLLSGAVAASEMSETAARILKAASGEGKLNSREAWSEP